MGCGGVGIDTQLNFQDPRYHLPGVSEVAYAWHIDAGITQGGTSVTTWVNPTPALKDSPDVQTVVSIGIQAHDLMTAERVGMTAKRMMPPIHRRTKLRHLVPRWP